ncbi:early nodulin-93-like [Curcuma longa]|uniref:early nodulin-93-like n=1 Tax=Curcuma longa TaxID=136217 RepID=UPI003D9DCAA8
MSTSESTVREAVYSGIKTATISGAIAAVPTLVGCRVIPWAKHNLNHTAQALIISAASVAGFFIAADKIVLRNARGNTIGKYHKSE